MGDLEDTVADRDPEAIKQDIDVARETITSSKLAYELALESLKVARRDYGLGMIDFQQLLVSQQALLNADVSYGQAKYDYLASLVRYFVAFGHDLQILLGLMEGVAS